eukprot:359056-Prorocentrum_minimum.AAC.1
MVVSIVDTMGGCAPRTQDARMRTSLLACGRGPSCPRWRTSLFRRASGSAARQPGSSATSQSQSQQ